MGDKEYGNLASCGVELKTGYSSLDLGSAVSDLCVKSEVTSVRSNLYPGTIVASDPWGINDLCIKIDDGDTWISITDKESEEHRIKMPEQRYKLKHK